MRTRPSVVYVRATLLSALGIGVVHCGSGGSGTLADAGPFGSDGGPIRADGGGGVPSTCTNPTPYLIDGKPTGYDKCDGGVLRRRGPATCPSALPRAGGGACTTGSVPDAGALPGACNSDADCTTDAHGHCEQNGGIAGCRCVYGCTSDTECSTGNVCDCGPIVGVCVPASCTDAAGCAGAECLQYKTNSCGSNGYACASPNDKCLEDKDCVSTDPVISSMFCGYAAGVRTCQPRSICGTGRPFLVQGSARVAATTTRADWFGEVGELTRSVDELEPSLRHRLAAAWTEAAQMEHASVAAFARFALELVSLGAPAVLLAETAAAMSDEIEHARLAFALASAYEGRSIGPGPLAVDGCLNLTGPNTRNTMIANLVREGCIGETIAAIEAREAASAATDPVVAHILARIADDEARHAALAWRTLTWSLDAATAEDRARILAELDRAIDERLASDAGSAPDDLIGHGVVGATLRSALAREAVALVIRPARADLSSGRSSSVEVAPAAMGC